MQLSYCILHGMKGSEMNSSGFGQGPVAGSREHSNDLWIR
jgi:hypothetical protein